MFQLSLIKVVLGVAVVIIVVISWFIWKAWRDAQKFALTISRLAPALLELEEFYELVDLSSPNAHFFERHGPMLDPSDVLERATSGTIKFSGLSGKAVASARWYRHADLLKAVNSALHYWRNSARPNGGIFAFRFNSEIGEGYAKRSKLLVKTRVAIVIIKEGNIITAYPLLDDRTISDTHEIV